MLHDSALTHLCGLIFDDIWALTMVADVNDPSNNKMRGVIKIPVMKSDQRYIDWKKELQVWEASNTILEVDMKLQAALLFESLEGVHRQIVLSELTVSEIIAEDGFQNIIKTQLFFYEEWNTQFLQSHWCTDAI